MTEVYVETGAKRTFAAAVDWPGWARSGRDEETALQALFDHASRYERIVRRSRLGGFQRLSDVADLVVVERLRGTSTTDFGAPDVTASVDVPPLDEPGRRRLSRVLRACWRAFDDAVAAADGVLLRPGPRGGGRDLPSIVEHVVGAEASYLRRIAGTPPTIEDPATDVKRVRAAVLDALASAARHGVPERGPRGGKMWTARYFVRRAAWHVVDHAWEIENRTRDG
jgi:hypothetical protein